MPSLSLNQQLQDAEGSTRLKGSLSHYHSTQPSIPPGQANRVLASDCMAGCVHLCWVATVWSHAASVKVVSLRALLFLTYSVNGSETANRCWCIRNIKCKWISRIFNERWRSCHRITYIHSYLFIKHADGPQHITVFVGPVKTENNS